MKNDSTKTKINDKVIAGKSARAIESSNERPESIQSISYAKLHDYN